MEHLIETALLTHGLKSVSNEEIYQVWTDRKENIAWISKGEIIVGNMERYLEFRKRAESLLRIDCNLLERALTEKLSGALTASGTMAVCQRFGLKLAVTCGMGGIDAARGAGLCSDLPALERIPVSLVSTGPKDMLEREQTIQWLMQHGILVLGAEREYCTGYIFTGDKVELSGKYGGACRAPMLIINEIPEEKRISDRRILEEAVQEGIKAEKEGRYYHPAVNRRIDELTKGYSSRLQLESLLANAELADRLQ